MQNGDIIKLFLNDDQLENRPTPAAVFVYEDDDIIIASKPAGIAVDGPDSDTLLRRVQTKLAAEGTSGHAVLCHRLDTGTSGLVLLAKNSAAEAFLTAAIKTRDIEKRYLCVTFGRPNPPAALLRDYLLKDAERGIVRITDTTAGGAKATKVSQLTVALSGTAFGVDFNPAADRLRMKSFAASGAIRYRKAAFSLPVYRFPTKVSPAPFVPPAEGSARKQRCLDILQLQARGLCQRMLGIGCKKAVIGISGGLDSTLALLVTRTAFDALGLPPKNIVAITMPCFATGEKTLKNATDLCRQMGTDFRKVDISAACTLHGQDIGHDMNNTDIAYENIQARERTQVLMDVANMEGGIVIGTGDLSELALGWCTYNGDHISHYGVNCGVPKTLVKFIVETYARELAAPDTRDTLLSILGTEITPELVPGGASTEERIGKYDLHDFFLYYFMRYGFGREKLRDLAAGAFGAWQLPEIERTLDTFLRRFFQNQFKRNCLPDGPKIGSVCLSPRGDWRMPADMDGQAWKHFDW